MTNQFGMNFGGTDIIRNPNYSTTRERLQFNTNPPFDPQYDIITAPAPVTVNVDLTQQSTTTQQLAVINHGIGYKPKVIITFTLPVGVTPFNSTMQGYSNGLFILSEGAEVTDYITYVVGSQLLTINHYIVSNGIGSAGSSYTSNCPAIVIKYIICNNVGYITQPSLT